MNPFPLFRLRRRLALMMMPAVLCAFAGTVFAQGNKPNKAERREMLNDPDGMASKRPGKADRRDMRSDSGNGAVEKPAPQDQQAKFLSRLREQMDVEDDDEWGVLAARILKLAELRRGVATSAGAGRSASFANNKKSRSSANPDQDALRTAVSDKMPEAEVRSRLSRLHDLRLQDEARLAKSQEELRAMLTVRQEAVAVMLGLLPP